MAKIANPRDIIIAPVVSEKSYELMEQNTYTFLVDPRANKRAIGHAIEEIFGVKVARVNTANRQGKRKRTRTGGYGQRKATKRAYVTLREGSDAIDIFGGSAA
ncbi:50S ribosomal protein L23 [Corynebacterium ciconiae DSM 44920]|uniref:50S ribosomal protein L23 n=1 Tax=Corynebacterium ciconiae TaxID=227319 RepID=UPI00035F2F82|nr:50S ribosomal protein L23 [Corynebacterium ciconiae]WKD60337.1 50S ribosomal protein L23 [Corynebacterium ciconiae DSM 44920]